MAEAIQIQDVAPGAVAAETERRDRAATRSRAEAWWAVPAFLGVIAVAAFTYIYNLTVSGYANAYYSMAAQAASLDWGAWFFGSLDPANFITIDKPPLATMLMGLSVRLFGLSSWSILLPEALAGIATAALVFVIVRKQFGPGAAVIAGVVTALTPAAVVMFRYDNPDALLTLLLVGAAWSFWRAMTHGGLRWIVLAAVLIGLAFNTKFLQAYLVLPAFALTYLIAARGSVMRRLGHLITALVVVVLASGWWVAAMELIPASARPYIGGSESNSAVELLLGYDGLQRIFGFFGIAGGPAASPTGAGFVAPGGAFAGPPGLLRLFNGQFGGQIAWLLPFALVGLVVGLVARGRSPRTDLRRAAYLFWGTWLLVHALVFSFMSGIVHTYYAVAMAPAIGALVGGGAVELWTMARHQGRRRVVARVVVAGLVVGSALLAADLLRRSPDFMPWLATVITVAGVAAAIGILLGTARPSSGRLATNRVWLASAAAAVAMVVLVAGPAAYAVDTMNTAYSGGDVMAGPRISSRFTAGGGGQGPTGQGQPPTGQGQPPEGPPTLGGRGNVGGASLAGASLAVDEDLITYLEANRGTAIWLVAVRSSNEAAGIQLKTGEPVMTIGGFNGSDKALTVEQLAQYVAAGKLRYIMVGSSRGPINGPGAGADGGAVNRPDGTLSAIESWVEAHGTVVEGVGDGTLYDLQPS